MSIEEVHQIVQGYEKVYRCKDWAEVYFYFSTDEERAFKYKIIYDEGLFDTFITDDIYGSMKVSIRGCEKGLLDE